MPDILPRLRMNLDFMPSPVADRPGLLIRDPFRYSDATLIVPPPLVQCLECFDGERTPGDLRELLFRLTGDLQIGELARHLTETLSEAGFLEDPNFERLRQEREDAFARGERREASQAGSGYPEEPEMLRAFVGECLSDPHNPVAGPEDGLIGLAAPHVSPEGGWETYQAAYRALDSGYRDRVFVILGTSHYGKPDRFGLTRKPFVTPYGEARTETALVDLLERTGGEAVKMEDYCQAVEHSIEFQVVFLQHVLGPDIRILPILCGAFAKGLIDGTRPEEDDRVRRFLDALGEIGAREGKRLLWVMGIDMAHMGRRYGDGFAATADTDEMAEVAVRDAARIERVEAGDADGFWRLVKENRDDLKWCGSAPLYTFLRSMPGARGSLRRYQQWNIDEQSVVSFGAMTFREGS
ncbi:MAG: AmmeMemoRadiSam system protein B [Bryobacterales bacterium]|nr:AmmeMemoRadiSam system protein B [Bryobacterales bacterium]